VANTSTLSATSTARAITWQWVRFTELRPDELYAAVQLREAVFVVEQECAYPDADGRDPAAWHLLGWLGTGKEKRLVAYARLFEPGVRYEEASIGRIVTSPAVRGSGFGRALMAEGLRRMKELAPGQPIRIAAQIRLEKFYSEYGFTTASEPYEEDGIIHVDMLR
jgi:ElaA protein